MIQHRSGHLHRADRLGFGILENGHRQVAAFDKLQAVWRAVDAGDQHAILFGLLQRHDRADGHLVDGILFLATVLTQEWAAIAQDLHQIPLVQVCRNTESEHIDVVNIDGYRAGEEIAGLLIEQGHRRFGYMKGPDTQSSHLLRMEGYRDKLMATGFQLDRVLTAGHYDRQRGFQLMSEYLQATPESERVEALFCENDVLALGALEALRQTAPSSAMAVVGFDDIDEAGSANWALTSYSQRIDRLVEEALNRLIDNRATADGAWRHGELRVRRSHVKQDEIQIAD